jgi:hypothetical protein
MIGAFSHKALVFFSELASESHLVEESYEEYDFTRCVRPDGSAYGTGGQCRKGIEQEKTVSLGEKTSSIIDSYSKQLKEVWPTYTQEQLQSTTKELVAQIQTEYSRVTNGEVTKEEVDDFLNNFQVPVLKDKKFLVIGMEPGKASDDPYYDFAVDLATSKVGKSKNDLELAMAAHSVIRSSDEKDPFARRVVGLDETLAKGNTFPKQVAQIRDSNLRPEPHFMSLAHGNVRPVAARSINDPGVYGAINSQKDPRLKNLNRKIESDLIKRRVLKMVKDLTIKGKESDFEGGIFAPGNNKESKELIKLIVDQYRSQGGRVVEHTTMIGAKKNTPLQTYSLALENKRPFVIFQASLNNLKLAGKNVREAYNDVQANFIKETWK